MNFKAVVFIGFIFLSITSCEESKLQIQNNISNVRIQEVYWGDYQVSGQLLPGQTSEELILRGADLPKNQRVSFIMYANQRSIYLETKQKYYLDSDDDILIRLEDDTEVRNPN